jgi:hypothetical protein
MAKRRKLTQRERAFIKQLPKNKTVKQAAIKAGYSPNNPDQSAHQALESIKLKMPELMDELGLTDKALIQNHLVPLLNAKETKFFQHNGKVGDSREVIAWGPRTSGLDIAFKLKGRYAERGAETSTNIGVQVIVVDIPRPNRPAIEVTPANGHKPE